MQHGFTGIFSASCCRPKYLTVIYSSDIFQPEGHGQKPMEVEDRDRDCDRDDGMKKNDGKCLKRDSSNTTANKDVSVPKMSLYANKDEYAVKPITEMDLSNREQWNPSYRLLPKNVWLLICLFLLDVLMK